MPSVFRAMICSFTALSKTRLFFAASIAILPRTVNIEHGFSSAFVASSLFASFRPMGLSALVQRVIIVNSKPWSSA
ncbi:hypothetical protein PsorP6_000124 [Peronosclerospora sorghi]|uniref:Uncharacterized protein n=1 Tax=Peronosclerospora sorghi TaxID=230839 RepID=A0ACC0WYP5_9STRA|nr:hypothetical protein PsorP6_000124 [Peronosclerospora sorghi]